MALGAPRAGKTRMGTVFVIEYFGEGNVAKIEGEPVSMPEMVGVKVEIRSERKEREKENRGESAFSFRD